MTPLIIFGTGKIADCVAQYFERSEDYELIGFTCDDDFVSRSHFRDRPVFPLSQLVNLYPPPEVQLFIALGYQGLNQLRQERFEHVKSLGYRCAHLIVQGQENIQQIGENSIVMDQVAIQPEVKIGANVFIWGGAMIGHHAQIEDHAWITGSANIGGCVKIGSGSFIGLNATIAQEVHIGERCILGANTLTTSSLTDQAVKVSKETDLFRLNSSQFVRISSLF